MALLPMAASIANGPGAAYIAARRDAVRTANQTPGTIIDSGPRAGPKAGMITKSRVVPAAAGFPGPLQPWSPAQIAAITARIQGQYGTPRTQAQIQADAQDQISPIIAALTKAATDRATGASAAIKGLTDSYAAQLAGENFQAPYQQAEQGQAAVDAALQQSLAGGGASLAADLKSRLGQINDPSVAAAASGLADRGAALGTTQLASGSSALSELIANAASAGEYGLKQPVIARNAGIQGVAQAQAQATNDIATGTQATLTQLPQIVQALEASNATLRGNRADAAASLLGTFTGQNITKATLRAGLTGDVAKANATVTAAQTRAAASAASKAASQGKISPTWSKQNGYVSDQNGNPILRNGQQIPYKGTGSAGGKPPTPATLAKWTSMAHDAYNGVAPHQHFNVQSQKWESVPGTGTPQVIWATAIKQLVAAGASKAKAIELLTAQGWTPGEGGRPTVAPKTPGGQSKPAAVGATIVQNGKTYQWNGTSWIEVPHP